MKVMLFSDNFLRYLSSGRLVNSYFELIKNDKCQKDKNGRIC